MFTFPFTMMSSADGAYTPAAALYLDTSDSLTRTYSSASDNTKKVTVSLWMKLLSHTTAASIIRLNSPDFDRLNMEETGSDDAYFTLSVDGGSNDSWGNRQMRHPKKVRDVTGWQNLVFTFDSTASSADIFRIFDNGVEIEPVVFPPSGNFVSDSTISWMANSKSPIILSSGEWLVADYIVLDGIAVTNADNFGETNQDTGIWVPKDPGTISSFGTNGFWLAFDDPTHANGVGKDSSGQNNHFTPSSMGANNIAVDGPANLGTKEITIHSSWDGSASGSGTLSNKNLTVSLASYNEQAFGNLPMTSGKYYWEITPTNGSTNPQVMVGICDHRIVRGSDPWSNAYLWGYKTDDGAVRHNNSNNSYGSAYGQGDIIGIAFDADNGALYFRENNGSWENSGDPTSGSSKTGAFTTNITAGNVYLPHVGSQIASPARTINVVFNEADWTYSAPSGYSALTKTVTGTGNAATLNPIASSNRKGGLSNGNLRASGVSKDNFSTMNIPLTGKWYFEGTLSAVAGTGKDAIGVAEALADQKGEYGNKVVVLYAKSGEKFLGTASSDNWLSYNATYVAGDTIGVYVNAGQVTFYKNGTSQGTCGSAFTTQCFATTQNANAATVWDVNFGQKPFIYTPPTDAKALVTQNLAEPTVTDPSAYFKAKTYAGNGADITAGGSGQTITTGFQPDFVWIKQRSTEDHRLFDSVRGAGNYIESSTTNDQNQASARGGVTYPGGGYDEMLNDFISTGFTLGNVSVNSSSTNYVAWSWKAGGEPTADNSPADATPTNNSIMIDGAASTTTLTTSDIYPTRATGSNTFKFGMIKYEGNGSSSTQTLANPFSWAPDVIFCKNLEAGDDWEIFHSSLGHSGDSRMYLNKSDAASGASRINAVSANQITFVASTSGCNPSSQDVMMYAWAKTSGAIAVGQYTGNGAADGPYVIVDDGGSGFKPAFFISKRVADSGYNWQITDAARDPENPLGYNLSANLNGDDGDGSGTYMDFTGNGVKIRTSSPQWNASGKIYIYLAFAETPFGLNNRAR